ncbi:AMP-binding protein [Streptomyces monashensis]|uniref:AMP-binding protein n=1 Tax=Streptomyces monashensis TaxID=1678012 RepID=UPI000D1BEF72
MNRFFEDSCDRTPHAVALECGEQWLTCTELDTRANQIAHRLRGLGLGSDSSVAPGRT